MKHDNATSYAKFCQFRKQVRGSSDYLIVGIDVAKGRHHAFFGIANGRSVLRRFIFDNTGSGFERLMDRCRQLCRQHDLSKVVYGIEPTGNYHKPLASWLLDRNQMLVLVSNQAIADNRKTLDGRWDKNDPKDSANVADLVAQGKCQFFERPDADHEAARSLLSLRKRLKKQEHRLRMQIRNGLVAKHFPELDRHWGSCLEENLAIVSWCLDPHKITAMSFKDFVCRVTTKDRGLRQVRRLQAIYDVACVSIGCRVDEAVEFEAQTLVSCYKHVREHLKQTESRLNQLCRVHESYRLLQTIPGFGPYVASTVWAAVGDPHRFAGRRHIIRLAGLDLNAKRSGKRSQAAVPVISKRGNQDLRYALYQAAQIATYHNDRFRALFMRYLAGREKERGIKTKVRVKLAAKMMVMAWTMMKHQMPFDPSLIRV